MSVVQQLGITGPMSSAISSPFEDNEDLEMKAFVDTNVPLESEAGWRKRIDILLQLEMLVNKWIHTTCGAPDKYCKVLTFGSFQLGLVLPSSDIDTLVMIPQPLSRDAFFEQVVDLIKEVDDVTSCYAITDARVPVIKVTARGVCLDILASAVPWSYLSKAGSDRFLSDGVCFASGECATIPDELIFQVDEKCMKSMNGVRVAARILELVPNVDTFLLATRMIKHWSAKRLIYNNAIGYFGGVSWAMAVARVCQLYPNFNAREIVERFFYVVASWPWPKPILLSQPIELRVPASLSYKASQYRDWNPNKYAADKQQSMPVVTPIFPSHNTTYNVTDSQRAVILDELFYAREVIRTSKVSQGRVAWEVLCADCPFFDLFNWFIELRISAPTDEVLGRVKGLVESRVRVVVKNLEGVSGLSTVRPHPEFFSGLTDEPSTGSFYIGIVGNGNVSMAQLQNAMHNYADMMERSTGELGNYWSTSEDSVLGAQNVRVSIRLTSREELPEVLKNTELSNS